MDKEVEEFRENHSEVKLMDHKSIIDEWFLNGYVGYKAVKKFRPNITDGTASQVFHSIMRSEDTKKYLQHKRNELRSIANIEVAQIVKELVNFSFSDVTDFDGLTSEQVKALPPEARRQIQSFKRRTKKYKDREGKEVVEEYYDIKAVDKIKSLDMLAKYIGLYEADNKQKQGINIEKLNVQELKMLQQILTKRE